MFSKNYCDVMINGDKKNYFWRFC